MNTYINNMKNRIEDTKIDSNSECIYLYNLALKTFENKVKMLVSQEYFELYQKKVSLQGEFLWRNIKINIHKNGIYLIN